MHLAAELARIDVVEMLLKAELDLTLRDKARILTNTMPLVDFCSRTVPNTLWAKSDREKKYIIN